jgi:hypothetical protein
MGLTKTGRGRPQTDPSQVQLVERLLREKQPIDLIHKNPGVTIGKTKIYLIRDELKKKEWGAEATTSSTPGQMTPDEDAYRSQSQ